MIVEIIKWRLTMPVWLITHLILVLNVNSIKIEQGCDNIWDVEYLKDADVIRRVVVIDTGSKANETDCFYKYIQKRNVSLIVLNDRANLSMEYTDGVHKKLKYRSRDLAFIVLLPYPELMLLMASENPKLFRWHTRAIIEIVIYKMEIKSENDDEIKEFLNQVIVQLKLIEVVVIVLRSRLYFSYDQDSMRLSKTLSCNVTRSQKPFNHTYLYSNSHKMRENYPVKITTFYRAPTAMFMYELSDMLNALSKGSNGLGGKDGFLMADIINYLKFTPEYSVPEGAEPYGAVMKNGTVNGVLKKIVEGTVDLSGNSRFLTAYGIEDEYYFVAYNHYDLLCGIVKKSDKIPLWVQIAQTYSLLIWSLLFFQTCLIAILRWVHYKLVIQRKKHLVELLIETLLSYIVPVTEVQKSSQKMLMLGNILVGIILVPMLLGNIRSAFTKNNHYANIDTLEELDEQYNAIYAPLIDRNIIFGEGNSDLFDRLNKKVISDAYAFEVIVEDVVDRDIALVMPIIDFKVMAAVKVTEILEQFHIVKECPRLYLYSFIASIDFPWVHDVEIATLRLVDAGLSEWYYEITLADLKLQDTHAPSSSDPRDSYVLDLQSLDGPFFLYLIGLLFSSMIFVLECFHQ